MASAAPAARDTGNGPARAGITVVGETVLDRVQAADGHVTEVPGGSPANVALALARAGVDASLRARFSRDRAGRLLRDHLARHHVDLRASVDTDDPATIVDARLDTSGSPTYSFLLDGAADFRWQATELATPLPLRTAYVHTGSLAATTRPGWPVLMQWARTLSVPVSYDVNVRPGAWHDDADRVATAQAAEEWVRLAAIVKASDEDIEHLHPESTWEQWAHERSRARVVVITRGAQGAVVFREGEPVAEAKARPVTVVDTVGAGDTFMAWLLAVASRFAHPQDLSDADWADAADLAVRAAAITCTRRGCDPPTAADLAA